MKISKKIVSLTICVALAACLGTATAFATGEADDGLDMGMVSDMAACAECGGETGHLATCSQYAANSESEPANPAAYEQLMEADGIDKMYSLLYDDGLIYQLDALSNDELRSLADRANALYDPDSDDPEFYEMVADGIGSYIGSYERMEMEPLVPVGYTALDPSTHIAANGNLTSGKYYLSSDVDLDKPLIIPRDGTVNLDLNGFVLSSKAYSNIKEMTHFDKSVVNLFGRVIVVYGTLVIEDSNPTKENRGSLIPVSRWVDKRLESSKLTSDGKVYESTNTYTDRYYWDVTPEPEFWVYDKTGSTTIFGGVITGGVNTSGGGIYVGGGNLTINGGTIAGNRSIRYVETDAETKFQTGTASNGGGIYSAAYGTAGGANYRTSTITMNGGAVLYNWTDYLGGGMCLNSSTVFTMNSGLIEENCAQGSGGGLTVRGGSTFKLGPDAENSYTKASAPVISKNKTFSTRYHGGGGGMEVDGGSLEYTVGQIKNNNASGSGGGIYCYRGGSINAKTAGSIIEGNRSGGSGGGIFIQYGDVNLEDCVVKNNKSGGNAGGVGLRVGNFTMVGGEISGNESTGGSGGGVHASAQNNISPHCDPGDLGSSVSITGTLVSNNSAKKDGGGVFVSVENSTANITVDIVSGTITKNSAKSRGGAVYLAGGILTVSENPEYGSTVVSENTASTGGAFFVTDHDRTIITSKPYKVTKEGWEDFDALTEEDVEFLPDVKPGEVIIESGDISGNRALTGNGGALYVNGSVTVQGGVLTLNESLQNGGAVCVSGGNFLMTGGALTYNTATNGGGVYVSDGNITVQSGVISFNEAIERTSGEAENGNEGYGGGAFADGGTVTVGIQECTQDAFKHPTGKTHPSIVDNTATFGGGIAVKGASSKVFIHCCSILRNESDNNGTGMNVFMGDGVVEYHYDKDSSMIGSDEDHGMVSIGGTLEIVVDSATPKITTNYYSNYGEGDTWSSTVPDGYTLNLPYCPTKWRDDQDAKGYVFVGWAEVESESEQITSAVRSKDDYEAFGDPVQMTTDVADTEKHFRAVWAPKSSYITFGYSIDGSTYITEHDTDGDVDSVFSDAMEALENEEGEIAYDFETASRTITIPNPVKPGYTLVGWRILAADEDEGISNWNADPIEEPASAVSLLSETKTPLDKIKSALTNASDEIDENNLGVMNKGEVESLLKTQQNFGNITLIAVFDCGTLTISRSNSTESDNQTYLYAVRGHLDEDDNPDLLMTVMIRGNGTSTIKPLPAGTYEVEEVTDWSWRYFKDDDRPDGGSTTTVSLKWEDEKTVALGATSQVSFDVSKLDHQWLSGESHDTVVIS